MPKEKKKAHYLCSERDESEPGTFKDREIMRWSPHALLEGSAMRPRDSRGGRLHSISAASSPSRGIMGGRSPRRTPRRFGSIKIYLHRGAGAYICGEETALIELDQGQARIRGSSAVSRPPPPLGLPTTINKRSRLSRSRHPQARCRLVQGAHAVESQEHRHEAVFPSAATCSAR